MLNYFAELTKVNEPGVYCLTEDGVFNYEDRWSYGYIVPIRGLKFNDLVPHTLVQLVHNGEGWDLYLVKHIDSYLDAEAMAARSMIKKVYALFDGDVKEIT